MVMKGKGKPRSACQFTFDVHSNFVITIEEANVRITKSAIITRLGRMNNQNIFIANSFQVKTYIYFTAIAHRTCPPGDNGS
jgi:hypothetical protein